MKILQQPVKLRRGERVRISFSRPATVLFMTDANFKRYKEGATFRRMGRAYDKSPVEFTAPHDGHWHAVIEKGAHVNPQPVTGSVEILPPERKEVPYFEEEKINANAEESPAESIEDSGGEAAETGEENPDEEE